MPSCKHWDLCCEEAKDQALQMGVMITTCSRMVINWCIEFQDNHKFSIQYSPPKHNLPPFLEQNNNACIKIQQYAHEHLHEFSIKLDGCEYIHDVIVPAMVKETSSISPNEKEKYDIEVHNLLSKYGQTCICPSTVYRWMKLLGFKYEQ